jgi:uncharacterized protein (DUF433 family)
MGNVIAAFDEEQAERLTGVTKSQLRYWDRTEFFSPTFNGQQWDSSVGRVYSFKDIVSLKVLNMLRNAHGVSLPHLRDVGEKLAASLEDKWTGVRLYVQHNKRVAWDEPGTKKPQEVLSGQYILAVVMDAVVSNIRRDIKSLNKRGDSEIGRIEKSRSVNHNDAVIAGTRIRVRAIRRFRDAGYTPKQILKEYPDLTERDVLAALEYGEARAAA